MSDLVCMCTITIISICASSTTHSVDPLEEVVRLTVMSASPLHAESKLRDVEQWRKVCVCLSQNVGHLHRSISSSPFPLSLFSFSQSPVFLSLFLIPHSHYWQFVCSVADRLLSLTERLYTPQSWTKSTTIANTSSASTSRICNLI